MAAGSANPLRQQMINMMYLVLTALLALNVSAEILKAFQTVNEGMDESIALINNKNSFSNEHLQKLYNKTPDALQEVNDKATQVNKICGDLFEYIEKMKTDIIQRSGGVDDHGEMRGMKDFETTTFIMVEERRGDELQKMCGKAHVDLKKIMEGCRGY